MRAVLFVLALAALGGCKPPCYDSASALSGDSRWHSCDVGAAIDVTRVDGDRVLVVCRCPRADGGSR